MKIVKVLWKDSGLHVDHGWASLEKYMDGVNPSLTEVETVGIVMHEDDDIIMVGMSYDSAHDTWYGSQVVLKSNVISVQELDYRYPAMA